MNVHCYACGYSDVNQLRAYRDLHATVFQNMSLFECNRCSLCFAWPPPAQAEIEKYYMESYWRDRDLNSWARCAREHWQQVDHARAQLSFISDSFPGHRFDGVLDIGAGFGEFLDVVRSLGGCNLCAVEISDDSAKTLENQDFMVVRKPWGELETTALVARAVPSVRLIRASHVLEHTSDPLNFISCIANVLDEEGIFMCEVPHDPIDSLLLPVQIRPQDTPHMLFFSTNSLRWLLEACGFRVVASGIYGTSIGNRNNKTPALVALIKQLLPMPIVRVASGFRAIVHNSLHSGDHRKSSSWQCNPKGSWLRMIAVKQRLAL